MDRIRDGAEPGPTALVALDLLSDELAMEVLDGLRDEPLPPSRVEEGLPSPPHSTAMQRFHLVRDAGLVAPAEVDAGRPRPRYVLTEAGAGLQWMHRYVRAWEAMPSPVDAPGRGHPGDSRIAALAGGWNSGLIREMGAEPRRRVQLTAALGDRLTKHQVHRRLEDLQQAGLVQRTGTGHGLYGLTELGRRSMGFVMLAAFWEYRYAGVLPGVTATPGPVAVVEALRVLAPLMWFDERVVGESHMTFRAEPRAVGAAFEVQGCKAVVRDFGESALDLVAWCDATMDQWEGAFARRRYNDVQYGEGRRFLIRVLDEVHDHGFRWMDLKPRAPGRRF